MLVKSDSSHFLTPRMMDWLDVRQSGWDGSEYFETSLRSPGKNVSTIRSNENLPRGRSAANSLMIQNQARTRSLLILTSNNIIPMTSSDYLLAVERRNLS